MLEQFHPRGVKMRDGLKNRAGYDRVLMAVAATFLTVSATSAFAQSDQVRNGAAELAIDAAIPRPEPANDPPPTASDFKPDSIVPAPDVAKVTEKAPETNPADVAAAPPPEPAKTEPGKTDELGKSEANTSDTSKNDTNKSDTATVAPAQPPAATVATPAIEPAQEPVKAASNVPAADQPVADKLRDMLGTKSSRYFDRKAERAAVE